MLNASRRWTNADAIVVPRRDALGGAIGELYPFTAALVEGPRSFRAQDLVAMAVAAGASRSVITLDHRAAVRHVRDAFSRGDLLAFRRPGPSEGAAPASGSIRVQGSFSIVPSTRGQGAHPRGWDAQTEYVLDWATDPLRIERTARSTIVAFDVFATRETITTTYYGDARPESPHDAHGSLGRHEERHRELAKEWWTTRRLTAIAMERRFALTLSMPGGVSRPEVERRVRRQVVAIRDFVTALHQQEQEAALDGMSAPPPQFDGATVTR